jgi:hypothetical protein
MALLLRLPDETLCEIFSYIIHPYGEKSDLCNDVALQSKR